MSKSKSNGNTKDVPAKATYCKATEAKFDAMLAGDLENLPPLPRSIVRIFVSSTFSDMRAERNALLSRVVPQLKEFCAGLDLDFQLVDLRWGISEDVQNDHSAARVCLQEVENCQNVSLGPNFISMMSHRYGSQALPNEIPVAEFESLRDESQRLKLDQVRLLDKWYLLDENCIPHKYVLQPIRTHFMYFGDRSSDAVEKRAQDTGKWWNTQTTLQNLLCEAATSLHAANKMSATSKHKYFQSVTESEIDAGVFRVENAQNQALFFHRCLKGLSGEALAEDNANKYIAVVKKDGETAIDQQFRDFIESCVKRTKKTLGSSNCQTLTTDWKAGGINPKTFPQHSTYIDEFCQAVISKVTKLVHKAKSDRKARYRTSEYYSYFDEVLHHLKFCNVKCESFCGQTKILKDIKDFILNSSARKPLIIHANSGAGKTSVMAKVMKNLSSWMKGDFIGVIRFLGTSPGSVNIYNVLFGVCGQLADCSDLIMEPVAYKTMDNLVDYIPRFFRQVASNLKKPVVILLDSIDQLSPDSDVFSMWWMPTTLPANVKLIISTLTLESGILDNVKKRIPDACYLEIPPLPRTTGKEIIQKTLKIKHRTVTEQQQDLLLTTFEKGATPLYLKLLLDEAIQWGSYSRVEDLAQTLAPSVRAAINLLFDRLEKKFGDVVVKAALGYITVGLGGVSEIELEDALSCDDTVLDDVYAFHDPPIDGIVRIPSVLWTRIRYDIREYLTERLSEGKITLFWYHRQFVEAAKDRYVRGKNGLSLHKTMFEIYLAESRIEKDIVLSKRKKMISGADRQVTPQPLSTANLRKLKCLTHHLIHASSALESSVAKEHVFCNFRFLSTKISALSTNAIVKDMEEYLENTPDEEITVLKTFLKDNKNNLKNPLILASSLLGYINGKLEQKYITQLLQSAKSFLQNQQKSILIPNFACLASSPDVHKPITILGFSTVLSSNDNTLLLHGKAVDMLDRDVHNKIANGGTTTAQVASYNLKTHTKRLQTSSYSPFIMLLFDLQLKEKCIQDIYSLLLRGSLVKHAVNSTRKYACVIFSDGNIFLLKVNSDSKGFQCLSHIKKSSDFTVSDIHCVGDDSCITVIATCQQNLEQESFGHVLIWKTYPDATFDNRSSAKNSELSQYRIKGIFTIFETEPHIPTAKIPLDQGVNNGMSFISGNDLFVCASDDRVSVIDTNVCEELRSWYVGKILHVCVSSSENLMLLHEVGCIKLFDITDGSLLHTISLKGDVNAVGVMWDEKLALTGFTNGIISSFDLTGQEMISFPLSSFSVSSIDIFGNSVVFASDMHEINILTKEYIVERSGKKSKEGLVCERFVYDLCITPDGKQIVTSTYGCLNVWSVDGVCIRDIPAAGSLYHLYTGINEMVIALDIRSKHLSIVNVKTGDTMLNKDLPSNVIAFTLTDDKTSAYAVTKEDRLVFYHVDLKAMKVNKLFALQKKINFETLSIILTETNRYLVMQVRCLEQEYQDVKTSWTKGGKYPTQPHPNKYLAIDLTQNSGVLLNCFRRLTKIPVLGITCTPYRGNVVLLTVRRHAIFWDIPTGKCDLMMSKSVKLVMNYRPDWTGGDKCTGSNICIVQSKDKKFLAVGSADGFLFIYSSETGMPVGMKAPATKHPSMVTHASVTPNNKLVASVCHSGVLKLWNPGTGAEVFSIQLDSSVSRMEFTPDSQHLILGTSPPDSKLLTFAVSCGTSC